MRTDHWLEVKASLEEEFEMTEVSEDKRIKLFELAWSFGYASGDHEVRSYYQDMMVLVK